MRHILNLLVLIYCATACGVDPAALNATPAPAADTGSGSAARAGTPAAPAASVDKNAQTYQNQDSGPISFAVADHKSLPSCDTSRDSQLAYVKAEKAFYVCELTQWGVIDIKGDAGAPGKDGKDGKDGVDGAPGKDGQTTVAAAAPTVTKTPRPLGPRDFVDSYTGLTWTKSPVSVRFDTAKLVCSDTWRLPTEQELRLAIARNVVTSVPTGYVWASSGNMIRMLTPEQTIGAETTDVSGLLCILVE